MCLLALLALIAPDVHAAYSNFPVRSRLVIVEDGVIHTQSERQNYGFRVEVLSDDDQPKAEDYKDGQTWITAHPEERYTVRLYNPLPVRVAVNLTVDGLNAITGKPSGISDGEKWMIDPDSFITIRGWQVNGEEARRFFFTKKPKSYAQWRGEQLRKDLSVKCGVIGAAYFWNQKELDQYYEDHPIYRTSYLRQRAVPCAKSMAGIGALQSGMVDATAAGSEDRESADKKQKAGTGMGERESHPTTTVEFQYDTGMYRLAQAVVIYYDFAQREPVPNPFPALSYAPEM